MVRISASTSATTRLTYPAMKRALAVAAFLFAAPVAHAEQRLVTFETGSAHVDVAKVQFNGPPPDTPPRPNALRVNVLLPDGYTNTKTWPVLYLLHGHGDAYDSWANPKRGDVRTVAKGFPGLIVMPEGARGWYVNWWNGGKRAEPGWERYFLDELVPAVDKRFSIRKGRRWHAIAGLSMGGEGAAMFAIRRPGYFGSIAAFSGPVSIQRPEWPQGFDTQGESHLDVFGDPEAQEFYWRGHNPTALAGNLVHSRVYTAVGDGIGKFEDLTNYFGAIAEADLRQHNDDFAAALKAAGVDHTYRPHQGVHDWPYWRADLADAIRWDFFKEVPAESQPEWSYDTVSQRGFAWGFRYRLAEPPAGLVTLRRSGTRIQGDGSGTVTITTPAGVAFTAALPFEREIPRKPRKKRKRARANR
jgi:S-formylglutathione hydrolase FrmB